jgi:membrane associated rhomboid family serine protease/Flp pilus assembly protein TadD
MANCIRCGRQLPGLTFGKKICQWCVRHEAAQRGEEDDDAIQPVIAAPWVQRESSVSLTKVLLGANAMLFVAMVISATIQADTFSMDFTGQLMVHFGANFGPYTLSGQWWRLFTYMFLHGGIFHIAMNMWCLWNLGWLCESIYGRFTYAAIYLITGVAGGLASVGWNPSVLSVGASGALFGLTGALIASFYLGEFTLSGINIKGTLSSLLFFTGFNLFLGRMVPGIDNACHVGGLVSGLMLGAMIALFAPGHNQPARRAGILVFMVIVLGGSAVGVQRWRGGLQLRSAISLERNIDSMIGELQKKVQQNPQDASAHYLLAHAYLRKGQFPEGESELNRVLDLQPQNTKARVDLGAVYLRQQQPKEAQEEFAKLVAQDPNDGNAHMGLGMALAAQNNHEAAINEFQTTLRLAPQAEDVYYRVGLSQVQLKQYDNAIASYLKERDRSGDDIELENALADAYQAKGMQQQAQDARNKAAQLRDQNTD